MVNWLIRLIKIIKNRKGEYEEMALGSGLMQGISETEFAPVENATRAQAAVLLWRFLERLE